MLVLHLEAAQYLVDAQLDIPEVRDEDPVWAWLHANYPLKDRRVPANDAALSFYSHPVEAYLALNGTAEKITTRLGGSLGAGGKVTVRFQPQNLPKVGAVKFEGTRNVGVTDLEKRLSPLAMQSDYTPAQFRLLVEQNIRPLYFVLSAEAFRMDEHCG